MLTGYLFALIICIIGLILNWGNALWTIILAACIAVNLASIINKLNE
jgi:hypothetical protein